MKAQTHVAGAVLFAIALAKAGTVVITGHGYLLFALFGSLLPDIDNHNSKIGQKLPGFSRLAEFLMGHRGIYHSFFGCAITLFVFFGIFKIFSISAWQCYLAAIAIGFLSHLVLDTITTKGIHWFKPIWGLWIRGPFNTGGWVDTAFSVAFLILVGFVMKGMGIGVLRLI
ncbi:MAG: metal-dependent hydrolase [Candidatus Undinarchaeales archaeon]|jgi:inner membrane protein|nr:metal-dependent hydrolase [Candidatus Undinarchaeales archaeon]